MNDLSDIMNPSHCLSQSQLIAYIQQKLEREEVYLVESHINDCSFCNDALEGIMDSDIEQVQQHLNEIKKQIDSKIIELKPTFSPSKPNSDLPKITIEGSRSRKTFSWLAAASILFLIGLGGFSVFSYITKQKHDLALHEKNSKSLEEAKYKKPDQTETGEIISLEVSSDSLTKSIAQEKPLKEDNKIVEKNITSVPNKIEDIELSKSKKEPLLAPTVAVAIDRSIADKAPSVDIEAPKAEKDNVENGYQNNSNNYAQEEKVDVLSKVPLSKKSSAGGLRKSKDETIQQSPAANQLNYSTYSNNNENFVQNQKEIENEKARSKKVESKSDYEIGLSLFNEGNYKKAIRIFEKATKKASGIELEDIQFHLAQAYLKLGRTAEAESLLNKLASSNKYKSNATELKKQVTESTKKK